MTKQKNADQAAEQDPLSDEYVNAVIRQHGYDSPETVMARLWQWIGLNGGENRITLLMYEAHKAMSKLRAEGVQPGAAAAVRDLDKRLSGSAAPQASPEPLARYCPGCGSVGPVGDEYRDCCPDGNQARMIPARLAEKCRDTFRLAIQTLLADAAANDSAAPQAGEAVRKQALHQAVDLVESFGRDAGAGRHFESSSYEAVVPAASNEISKLIRALADRPAPPAVKDGAGSKEHQ